MKKIATFTLMTFLVATVVNAAFFQEDAQQLDRNRQNQIQNQDLNRTQLQTNRYDTYNDKFKTEKDKTIANRIRNALEGSELADPRAILITVNEGKVVVDGQVQSNDEVKVVLAAIRSVTGVNQIENRLAQFYNQNQTRPSARTAKPESPANYRYQSQNPDYNTIPNQNQSQRSIR